MLTKLNCWRCSFASDSESHIIKFIFTVYVTHLLYIIRITIAASKITAAATLSPLTEVSESELRTLAKIKVFKKLTTERASTSHQI